MPCLCTIHIKDLLVSAFSSFLIRSTQIKFLPGKLLFSDLQPNFLDFIKKKILQVKDSTLVYSSVCNIFGYQNTSIIEHRNKLFSTLKLSIYGSDARLVVTDQSVIRPLIQNVH